MSMTCFADTTHRRDINTARALLERAQASAAWCPTPAPEHSLELPRPWDPRRIVPSTELSRGHFLERYITAPALLAAAEVRRVLEQVELPIRIYGTGTMPASTNVASHYAEHAWTRDTAICALALVHSGRAVEGLQALTHLAVFYNQPAQRHRFLRFHDREQARDRYLNPDCSLHPHIKGRICQVTRRLVHYEHPWGHNQLDAIGMWLYAIFTCANEGLLNLGVVDAELTRSVNGDNSFDSIFCVALKFLARIRYFEQHDTGPWEDRNLPRRATSMGSCLAAFRAAHRFFARDGWAAWSKGYPPGAGSLRSEVEEAIERGERSLEQRVDPWGDYAIENDRFSADASLIFLLHPFNPGLHRAQEDAILRTVYRDRMGEIGFTRRCEDDYVGMDYAHERHLGGVMARLDQPGYRAAEWSLFDPLLAAFYYRRFVDSAGLDRGSLEFADRHLKRALTQVTSTPDMFSKASNGQLVFIEAGVVPEAWWFDSREGRWRANENTPLPMTAAAYTFMFEAALTALRDPVEQ